MDINKVKNKKKRIFKIYFLKDPRDMKIKYVGVTVSTLNQRLSQHIYEAKTRDGTFKRNWINSLLKINQKPIICLVEYANYKNWEQKEILWIKRLNNLTNTNKGGAGMIINRKENSINKSARGHWKRIVAINNNKNILHFKSIKEATNVLKIPQTNISEVLSGRSSVCYGYHFIYFENYYKGYENTLNLNFNKRKKISFIYNNEFFSCKELSKKLNCSTSFLNMLANKKRDWKKSKFFTKTDTLEIIMI